MKMKHFTLKCLFTMLLCCMGWAPSYAEDTKDRTAGWYREHYATEYERAQGTYEIGKSYSIYTEVNGVKWYLTLGGDLSNVADLAGEFIMKEGATGEFPKSVFLRYGDGTRSFVVLDFVTFSIHDDGEFLAGRFGSRSQNSAFDSQVLLMDESGKYAIRASNESKTNGNDRWNDYCSNTYWAIQMVNDVPVIKNSRPVIGNTQGVPQFIWQLGAPVSKFLPSDFELDETKPLINDIDQLSSPWCAPHDWEGDLSHLLDNDPETYWGTNWTNSTNRQYVQVALDEPIHELVSLKFTRRHMNYNKTEEFVKEHVTTWGIYGAKDPDAEEQEWVLLCESSTPYNKPGETLNTIGFDTQGFQYLRIYGESTNTSTKYWSVAEIQLYPCAKLDDYSAALNALEKVYLDYEIYAYTYPDLVGEGPGQYPEEKVDAFLQALTNGVDALDGRQTYTAEGITALTEAIKSTYQAMVDSKIPFTLADGYYRLRHGVIFANNFPTGEYDEEGNPVMESREVNKYMYSTPRDGKIVARWGTPADLDTDCPSLWYVSNKDGLFDIKNCATDARFNNWDSSVSVVTMSEDSENLIAADLIENLDGLPLVALRVSTQNTSSYFHPLHHGINANAGYGTGTEDDIIGWANDASKVSEWYFEPVDETTALAIIKAYEPYKDDAARASNFKSMRDDTETKLKVAKDLSLKNILIRDVKQLSSPWSCGHAYEGNIAHLIDNDPVTYWHTNWNNNTDRHYVQVALNEPVNEPIKMRYVRRLYNYNSTVKNEQNHPTEWSVYGSDDPSKAEDEWEKLAEFETPYTEPGETFLTDGFDTKGMKYLRFYAEANNSGNRYWHAAELQLCPASKDMDEIYDPETSQYHMMGAIGTTLNDLYEQLKDIDPATITVEQYTAYKAAYEAFVAKFVDPSALRAKIESVKGSDEIVVVGTAPGFWKDKSVSDNLEKMIADAKAYDAAGVYTAEKSAAFIAGLDSVVANIKPAANPILPGKWYRIRFGTEDEYTQYGWNKSGNEPTYRVNEGDTTAVTNEGNFGRYMTVGKSVVVNDEDDYGEYSYYTVEPIEKAKVAIDDQLYSVKKEKIADPDMALFQFIPFEDAYIIQNKATGLYLQKKMESNDGIYLSVHPSLFTQEVVGYGQNALFIKTLSKENQNPLHFARNKNVVITWGNYGDSDGRRGCFFIEEAEDVAPDYAENTARIKMWDGEMTARCYPVAMTAVDPEQGEMWNVASIEKEDIDEDYTVVTVTLCKMEKNTAGAGYPFIYVKSGDYEDPEERDEDAEPELVNFTFGSDFVTSPKNEGPLKGVFSRTTIGIGVLTVSGEFVKRTSSESATTNSNTAYITDEDIIPRTSDIDLEFDETITSVSTALQKVAKGGDIYTLDGTFVKKGNINSLQGLKKGTYVIDGIKAVVK